MSPLFRDHYFKIQQLQDVFSEGSFHSQRRNELFTELLKHMDQVRAITSTGKSSLKHMVREALAETGVELDKAKVDMHSEMLEYTCTLSLGTTPMPLLTATAATIECCSIEPHSFKQRERTPFPTVPLVTNAEGIQVNYDSLDVINACKECALCITEQRGLTFDEARDVLDKAVHILRTSHNGKRADTERATAVFLMVLKHVVHEYPQEQINADMLLYAMDVI